MKQGEFAVKVNAFGTVSFFVQVINFHSLAKGINPITMKPTRYLLLLLIVISFTLSSCKKSESPKEKSRTELLTQKPWILVKWRYNIAGGDWVDAFSKEAACENDDVFTFKTDQSCTRAMGTLICNPEFPQPRAGKWSFPGHEGYLYLKYVWRDDTFIIDALNENTMALRSHHSTINDEFTFAHP